MARRSGWWSILGPEVPVFGQAALEGFLLWFPFLVDLGGCRNLCAGTFVPEPVRQNLFRFSQSNPDVGTVVRPQPSGGSE